MNWIIFGIVMGWLGIVSWFDIRKNEIPHPAWVVIPLMLACLYCVEQGGWSLVLMTAAVSMASERKWFTTLLKMNEVRMLLSWTSHCSHGDTGILAGMGIEVLGWGGCGCSDYFIAHLSGNQLFTFLFCCSSSCIDCALDCFLFCWKTIWTSSNARTSPINPLCFIPEIVLIPYTHF